MYKVILTVIHNVRRFVGNRLLPKAYTVISLGVFFYVAATLKSVGEGHQIEPNIAISSLSSNMPEGQDKSPVRYI